jgi:microcystin degradation protein MlrC
MSGSRRWRIAFGGIAAESCTFSPVSIRLEDLIVLRGSELLDPARYPFLVTVADAEFLPTIQVDALPGGPVDADAYRAIRGEFLDRLAALGPLDGLYLDLHGALFVTGMEDAEADWVRAARNVVGNDCLIAASNDLHGNPTPAIAASIDIITAFRTAPHIDAPETRSRAVELLLGALRVGIRPSVIHVGLPLLIPGEMKTTDTEPMAGLYGSLPQRSAAPGILEVALWAGHTWADEPRVGGSVAVTGTDRAAMEAAALSLASDYWEARHGFHYAVEAAAFDACIARARTSGESTVFISDAGDNLTAGAPGDGTFALERLLALGVENAVLAPLHAPAAVHAFHELGVGKELQIAIGQPPLEIAGRAVSIGHDPLGGATATVRAGGVTLVLVERREAFTTVAHFERAGLDPLAHRIVVVKLGYLYPDLARIAPLALLGTTPGATDLVATRLPYRRLRRPIFPLDADMTWVPSIGHPEDDRKDP